MIRSIIALLLLSSMVFSENKIMGSENGRFVFGQINDFAKETYMLDTQTGQIWRLIIGKDSLLHFQPITYEMPIEGYKIKAPSEEEMVQYLKEKIVKKDAKNKELDSIFFGDVFKNNH